jgi:urease accessory protein
MRRLLPRLAGITSGTMLWVVLAMPALAHEQEVIRYGSFLGGFTHPVLGPDHLLAMLSVGILSTQIGGRAILTVPAAFVTFMALGGVVGVAWGGIPMELIELGIAGSVLVLGAIIALGRRMPVLVAMAAVGFFGTMHGYAHGVETPAIAEPVLYALGFLSGTATIHLAGVLIGEVALKYRAGVPALRTAGAAIALMGALFLLGVV